MQLTRFEEEEEEEEEESRSRRLAGLGRKWKYLGLSSFVVGRHERNREKNEKKKNEKK